MTFSTTQVSNYASIAGMIVLGASYFGYVLPLNDVTFWLAIACTTVSNLYSAVKRYQKGDVSLLGVRK
jgi:4-hydroxybenzoate polyprenyltransferase